MKDPTRCHASEARDDWDDFGPATIGFAMTPEAQESLDAAIADTPPDHPDYEQILHSRPTPGPWFAAQCSAGGWEVNVSPARHAQSVAHMSPVEVRGARYISGSEEANARLIAAAPDLLEALEWCLVQFEGESGAGVNHWETEPGYRAARSAHAKATGKETA